MKKKLIIVIYSDLLLSGGGRETWLKQFVENEIVTRSYSSVAIVSARSTNQVGETINFPSYIDHYFADVSKLKSSIFKILAFCNHVSKSISIIRTKDESELQILAIGSFNEALACIIARNNTDVVNCWLRGIWQKEVSHRHSKYMVKCIFFVERFLLHKCHAVISNGKDTADFYKLYGIDSIVVNNGIDITRFDNNRRGELNKIHIGFVGRISQEKGIYSFIDAVKSILSSGRKNLVFEFIGHGPEMVAVIQLQEQFPECIRFVEGVSNSVIPEVLSNIQISLHLTGSKEVGGGGVSHSLLESMAAGHRIVCWDNPIFNQISGNSAFYKAKEGDTSKLTENILLAIDDESNGNLSRIDEIKHHVKQYSFNNHVKSYFELVS